MRVGNTQVLSEMLGELEAHYNVSLVVSGQPYPVDTYWGDLTARNPTLTELAPYLPLFCAEFSLYPPLLVRYSRMQRIVFACDLCLNHVPTAGLSDHNSRSWFVNPGPWQKPYARWALHHEFFHTLDNGFVEESVWHALNPPGFVYSAEAFTARCYVPQRECHSGFLTRYAARSGSEDRAELFAGLMLDPEHVAARVRVDSILAAKESFLKQRLHECCSQIDSDFWKRMTASVRVVS